MKTETVLVVMATVSNENFMKMNSDKDTKWLCHTCSDKPFSKCEVKLPPPDVIMSSIDQAVWEC